MTTDDNLSGVPTLFDIANVNLNERDLTAQCVELLRLFSDLKSREDRKEVLGYARRLLEFAAQSKSIRRV